MSVQFGPMYSLLKKIAAVICLLFFINASQAQITPQVKDPSNPEGLPTQLPPAQLYDFLKDKNQNLCAIGDLECWSYQNREDSSKYDW